jgi:hypothetical protein
MLLLLCTTYLIVTAVVSTVLSVHKMSSDEEKAAKTKKSCPRLHDIMMVRCYDVDMLVELMN